jgi:hypothetical protein
VLSIVFPRRVASAIGRRLGPARRWSSNTESSAQVRCTGENPLVIVGRSQPISKSFDRIYGRFPQRIESSSRRLILPFQRQWTTPNSTSAPVADTRVWLHRRTPNSARRRGIIPDHPRTNSGTDCRPTRCARAAALNSETTTTPAQQLHPALRSTNASGSTRVVRGSGKEIDPLAGNWLTSYEPPGVGHQNSIAFLLRDLPLSFAPASPCAPGRPPWR